MIILRSKSFAADPLLQMLWQNYQTGITEEQLKNLKKWGKGAVVTGGAAGLGAKKDKKK